MRRPPPKATLFPYTTLFGSADDIMLGYQSTSFHDSHYLRQALGLRPAPEFERWLVSAGVMDDGNRSEEHTSELQSRQYLVCRLLLEKKTRSVVCTFTPFFCL